MAANLKGNLGLKSSPLAPTACKLSTQYLVLDHMSNHYNKIAKAKSAIDSKPPKSLFTSQKLRDRRNRNKVTKSPRTRPATAMSQDAFQSYQDVFNDDPDDEEERLVHSIMKSTLLDKGQSSTTLHESTYMDTRNLARPDSAMSVHSGHSLARGSRYPMATASSHDATKLTYQGDVLEKRPYLFTEPERPFTPRTLKNNHQSRLKNSKCYNPPPIKPPGDATGGRPPSRGSVQGQEVRSAPKPQPRNKSSYQINEKDKGVDRKRNGLDRRDSRDSFHGLGETMESTGQLSESMLMDITIQSRDPQRNGGMRMDGEAQGVPPLAISMDKDHMNWLQEQASKAQVRARGGSGKSGLSFQHKREHEDVDDDKLIEYESDRGGPVRDSIRKEAIEKDEDQKYLAFAKEVTDDVLSRGICTDSVLHRVFENHIERKKDKLDENRMRQVIRDLRRDLGLRDSSAERTPLASLSDQRRNNTSSTADTMGPVTVITNGETSNGSQQQTSSGSKATTSSTSVKDESSSNTFSPGHHYSKILKDGSSGARFSNGGGLTTTTTLEPLNVMTSPSENGSATMDSVSSFRFGQTGEMVDTITSHDAIQEDTAREREEEEADDESDELSATQALKQYAFDLTVKEGTAELSGGETSTINGNGKTGASGREDSEDSSNHRRRHRTRQRGYAEKANGKLERPATGERRTDEGDTEESKSDQSSSKKSESRTQARQQRRESQRLSQEKDTSDTVTTPPQQGSSLDDEDATSVKSTASSQRPAVRPRSKFSQQSKATEEPVQSSDDRGLDDEKSVSEAVDVQAKSLPETPVKQQSEEDESKADDEYDDDYEEDEDDAGDTTHRTSDDDF